ncbi:MAG TPA: 50S ribosomal protein L3 [Candidatus Paceibacterota bacterium]|nr:50S ribosomal protein L3 [Candidatus Paceibacterota bacterium]
MKFILGRKLHMTQRFDEAGNVQPVTMVVAVPNVVTKIKTADSDGYGAVQVGLEEQKSSRLSKAVLGAFGGKGYKEVKEFRVDGDAGVAVGNMITVGTFSAGDDVTVTGTSKSKGFQGVVKRHGFHGGPRTHGQKHSEREPGSIGGGLRTRVPKGMRMAGRTGGDTVTVSGLKVVAVDPETNTLFISGAVPGRRGTLIEIVSK